MPTLVTRNVPLYPAGVSPVIVTESPTAVVSGLVMVTVEPPSVAAVIGCAPRLATAFETVTQAGGQDAYGALPKSIQLPWLVMPDQPSAQTHGGSIRPVEWLEGELAAAVPAANVEALGVADVVAQSAVAQ